MEGEAAFVADRVIAVSERLKTELCATYQLPEETKRVHLLIYLYIIFTYLLFFNLTHL